MNPSTFGIALALGIASLAPLSAAAQEPAPLTLQQAVAIARENNPDILAQRNDIRGSRATTRAARASLLPSAGVSSTFGYTAAGEARVGSVRLRESEPAYYTSSYSAGLTYDLSGAKLLQPRVARVQEDATRQRIAGSEANLVGQVAQQFLSVLQADELVAQAERDVARTVEHERLAKARLDVGAGIPLDLRRAEVKRGQAEVRVIQARNTAATEKLRLGQLMGAPLAPNTPLASAFSLFEPTWEADSLVHLALQNNPSLLAARANEQVGRTGVRAARYAYLPTMQLQVGLSGYAQRAGDTGPLLDNALTQTQQAYAGCLRNNQINSLLNQPGADCSPFNTADPAVTNAIRSSIDSQNSGYPFGYNRQPLGASVSFSLPIFNGLQRERQIEEARVSADDARHQVRAQELRLHTEIAAAVLNLETSYRTAQLQDRVRATAMEELRMAQERFRYGAASAIEVTDAQTSLAQAEQAQIDAVYNFHKSLAALEALVGQPLR